MRADISTAIADHSTTLGMDPSGGPPPDPHGQSTSVLEGAFESTLRVHALVVDVVQGPDLGTRVRIDQPTFVIGTGASADLRLTDDTVSREHLRLQLTQAGVRLRDEGSTNGTWIGPLRIHDTVLAASATVVIGSTSLAITVEAAPIDLPLSKNVAFGSAIGVSASMRHLFATLELASPSDATVLIEGESGVGKELLAQGIHLRSARAAGPFVAVDCGAIPPTLIESELFGHERGAFTGAERMRVGVFEQANEGTLFLDEIGELPLELQPKLLRALESREIRRVGGRGVVRIDARVVAATNRKLADAAAANTFRRDLYYRLAVVRAHVPPLRDRKEDVIPLALTLLRKIPGFESAEIPPPLASMLTSYAWPGNVRELRNVMERYAVLGPNAAALFDVGVAAPESRGGDLSHLPFHEARKIALDRFERAYLPAVLERGGGVVTRAAALAQVGRGSFHRMLGRLRGGGDDGDEPE